MQIPGIDPDKLKGGWKMVRDMIADTVGPMALLGIAAQKFVAASAGAALNAQKMAEALKASDGAERLKQQFEQLLGSTSAARKQIEMLAKVASGSAFSFDSLAEASKNLQVLTNGALNSEKALKRVQDVAAATGAPVDTMATAVADLYNALKSGDGVEAASSQLKNMGAISDTTAQKLESLNASGVSLAATWQVVEADLSKANGAASALGGTIAGLQQQLANIQQGSNTKIGEMFAEGEKAGLRAAIGFQKFTAAVEEANAGPWAAFNAAINSGKEALGSFLGKAAETAALKGIFQALAVAAIGLLAGAFVPILTIIGPLVAGLYKVAAATKVVQGAMAGARGWSQLWAGTTVAITASAAAMAAFGAKVYEANQSMRRMRDEFAQFQKDSSQGIAKTAAVAYGSSLTPEERDSASKDIEAQIARQKEAKTAGQKNLDQARSDQEGEGMFGGKANPFNIPAIIAGFSNEITARGQVEAADQNIQMLSGLQGELNGKAMENGTMGADAKMLEISRRRLELEKQIADAAKARLIASSNPEQAAKFAAQASEKAAKERKLAEDQAPRRYDDQRNTENATNKYRASMQRRESANEGYMGAVNENAQIAEQLGVNVEDLNTPVSPEEIEAANNSYKVYKKSSNAVKAQVKLAGSGRAGDYQRNQEIINARRTDQSAPMAALGEVGVGLNTDVEKIQADMARRQALIQEERDAITAKFSASQQPTKAGRDAAGAIADERMSAVTAQIEGLKDYQGNAVGRGGLGGQEMNDLQNKLTAATEAADVPGKVAADEEAKIRAQAAKEAAAAAQAEIAAGQRKLNIQKQIAVLRGMEGGDGKAAEAELGPEIAQLNEKKKAVEALKTAEDDYNKALNSGNKNEIAIAEANYNQKRADAFGAGMKAGDSPDSIDQEVQGMNQILDIRKQQAAIEQAAAQRRRDDLMNEMKMTNQILQLRLSEARGTTPGKTTQEIERGDRTRKRKDLESAEGVVAERDAAIKAGNSDLAMTKKKELEALGVDANATAQDVSLAIRKNRQEEIGATIAEAGGRRQSGREAKIASLEMQEEYATTDKQREKARKEKERLQDEANSESKAKEFRDAGYGAKDAEKLAKNATEMERLASDIEKQRTTRVDSLTAVGGGSGFVGLTPSQDKLDRLRELTEKQNGFLDRIARNNEDAFRIAQAELRKDK